MAVKNRRVGFLKFEGEMTGRHALLIGVPIWLCVRVLPLLAIGYVALGSG